MKSASLLFVLAGAVLAAFGQVSFKFGADGRTLAADFLNPWIFLGLCLYAASTVLWIVALSSVPLTVVYPFTALTYLLVNMLAFFLLGERMPVQGMVGTLVVLAGLFLVATSMEVHHASR